MEEYVATHLGQLFQVEIGQEDTFKRNKFEAVELRVYIGNGQTKFHSFPSGILSYYFKGEEAAKSIVNVSNKISGEFHTTNTRRMFVFGAGASFQCGINKSNKTGFPTTNKLLLDSKLMAELQKSPIGNDLLIKSSFDNGFSLEFELEQKIINLETNRFSKNRASDITLMNVLFGEYFYDKSNEITTSTVKTLYDLFISRLMDHAYSKQNDENFIIVNFNYDTLLEGSIEKLSGNKYNSLVEYIAPKFYPFRYYKPHGSCNWGLELDSKSIVGNASSMTLQERIVDNIVTPFEILFESVHHKDGVIFDKGSYFDNKNFGESFTFSYNLNSVRLKKNEDFKDTNMFYPVIHLPFAKKDTFLMPPLLRYQLNSDLNYVEEMFIIGFRMSELYFNNVLKATFERNKRLKVIWVINPDYVNITNYLKQTFNLNGVIIKQVRSFREFVCYHLESVLSIPTQSPASDLR